MPDLLYVYTDKNGIIQEIDVKARGELVQYELNMIPRSQAQSVVVLQERWLQNENTKNLKFALIEHIGEFTAEKTVYIYYHFKDKSIRSITPRKQQAMDEDNSLLSGLALVDSLVKEFIDGTKNMLNYKINDDGALLLIEEIFIETIEYDFLNNIPLLSDYAISENNDEATVEILYDGEKLNIKSAVDTDVIKYQLFFISAPDKTKLYASISFDFLTETELEMPLDVPDDYIVISSYKKVMNFTEKR